MVTLIGPLVINTASTTSIPVLTTHDPSGWRVIYSLEVPNLQPGNILHIKAQMEVSNGAVSLCWALIRADSATSVTGFYLKTPVSMTFAPQQHHYAAELWAFDSDMPTGTYYYNLIASAKNKEAAAGQIVEVNQGYGDITAIVFAP